MERDERLRLCRHPLLALFLCVFWPARDPGAHWNGSSGVLNSGTSATAKYMMANPMTSHM